MTTKEYRRSQFQRLPGPDSEFSPKLKIVKADTVVGGETNWLDITELELIQIRKLLIK